MRLENILESADTLNFSNLYGQYSVSVRGRPVSDRFIGMASCAGTRCVLEDADGEETEIDLKQDLIDPSVTIDEVNLDERAGFDTATIIGRVDVLDLSESVSDLTVTTVPSAYTFGFWGNHGSAGVILANGPIAGQTDTGISFSGTGSAAGAYAWGETSGTNPTGLGSATWRGVVEAVSTQTFERHQGTSTLTIPDLSMPLVGIEIEVPGHNIGSPAWDSIPLRNGSFAVGARGRDLLEGAFYGEGHEETYGLFDTGDYVGAFGAMQE